MKQLQALRGLAEKVQAGNSSDGAKAHEALELDRAGLQSYFNAYNGSLDAAHSLHKAVLGDDYLWHVTGSGFCVIDGPTESTVIKHELGLPPARAWIIAVIRAKIAELEGDG